MKSILTIFSAILLLSNCGAPELTGSQKFEKIQIGMPLQEVLDIYGLKDTIGKSYTLVMEVVATDSVSSNVELMETGKMYEVLSVDLDSTYTIILSGDKVYNKIDNTEANRIIRESDKRKLEKELK